MAVHIIWDNSNIFIGGQDVCSQKEPAIISFSFRIDFRNLYDLVLNTREAGHRFFGGSVPPECVSLWGFVRGIGCETNLLHRVEHGEQAVDEVLHLKMANLVLDIDPPETLALLSGDGKVSEFDSSFPSQAERALKKGWEVEIYSWEESFSHKAYDTILNNYSNAKYICLDDYYESLTFIKEGDYYYKNGGNRREIYEIGRAVKRLILPRT